MNHTEDPLPLEDAFDFGRGTLVYPNEHPELYADAVAAVSDGNGTLTYGGKLWSVGVIEAGKILELYPAKARA